MRFSIKSLGSPECKRMLRFGLSGGINTGVDFALFYALTSLAGLDATPAQPCSYLAGVVSSWFLNRFWVFGGSGATPRLGRFLLVTGSCALLTGLAMLLASGVLALPDWPAKILVSLLGMGYNYLLYRNWVFKPTVL